jgi:hypothetical protein
VYRGAEDRAEESIGILRNPPGCCGCPGQVLPWAADSRGTLLAAVPV